MTTEIKICGLKRPEEIAIVAEEGGHLFGLVFFPPSPRAVSIEEGRALRETAPGGLASVALVVEPDDALLERIAGEVKPDYLQFHGLESPERVEEVKARFQIPVIKAIAIETASDVSKVALYTPVADRLLFDAKPPKSDPGLPGGNGLPFDWELLAGQALPPDWILSGGLTPENVAAAVELTKAPAIDVSSGVESARGVKDPQRIRDFIRAVRAAER